MNKAILIAFFIACASCQYLRKDIPQLFSIEDLAALGGVPFPFKNCGSSSDPIQTSSVTISATPSKGGSNGITVNGSIASHIELKEADLKVLLNGSPLHTEAIPKTDVYESGDNFNFSYNVAIPSFAPSGSYDVSFTFVTTTGAKVGCVDLVFNL